MTEPEDAEKSNSPKKRVPMQRYYVPDLDALLAAHVVSPGGAQVIPFPSLALREPAGAVTAA